MVDDAYEDERSELNVFGPLHVLLSERSVDDAALPDDVSTQIKPADVVLSVPTVDVAIEIPPVVPLIESADTDVVARP